MLPLLAVLPLLPSFYRCYLIFTDVTAVTVFLSLLPLNRIFSAVAGVTVFTAVTVFLPLLPLYDGLL